MVATQNKAGLVPLSLCIVTNRFDDKLEEIVRVTSNVAAELLIGYDGRPGAIPVSFTTNPKSPYYPCVMGRLRHDQKQIGG